MKAARCGYQSEFILLLLLPLTSRTGALRAVRAAALERRRNWSKGGGGGGGGGRRTRPLETLFSVESRLYACKHKRTLRREGRLAVPLDQLEGAILFFCSFVFFWRSPAADRTCSGACTTKPDPASTASSGCNPSQTCPRVFGLLFICI